MTAPRPSQRVPLTDETIVAGALTHAGRTAIARYQPSTGVYHWSAADLRPLRYSRSGADMEAAVRRWLESAPSRPPTPTPAPAPA